MKSNDMFFNPIFIPCFSGSRFFRVWAQVQVQVLEVANYQVLKIQDWKYKLHNRKNRFTDLLIQKKTTFQEIHENLGDIPFPAVIAFSLIFYLFTRELQIPIIKVLWYSYNKY